MTNYYHDGADRLTREFEILRPIAYIPFEWSAFETLQICLVFMFSFFFFFCFQTKPTTVFCDQRYRYYIHITVYRKKKKKNVCFFYGGFGFDKRWKDVSDDGKRELCRCDNLRRFYVGTEERMSGSSFNVF